MSTKKKVSGSKPAAPTPRKVSDGIWETDKEFAPVESNSSAILYKKMPGDMILITGFRNILTADEIEKKYGKDIFTIYMAGDFVTGFYNGEGKFGISVGFGTRIYPGKVYSKKDFAKLVVTLKSAGKLLAGIVAACKNSEVKEVEL
jgi:hypothetical protein